MPTPEEQRVLDDIKAQTEAGGDPFGDDDAPTTAAITTDHDPETDPLDETPEVTEPDGAGEGEGAGEDQPAEGTGEPATGQAAKQTDNETLDPEVLADIADPLQLNQRPVAFKAEVPADLRERRVKLMGEKAEVMKKLMDGEIDADQYAAEELRITDALDELTRQQVRAETLTELNAQNAQQHAQQSLNTLVRRTKAEVDYTKDPEAPKQFDRALNVLLADPENAGRDIAEVYEDAHKMVLALRGIKPVQVETPAAGQAGADTPPNRRPAGGVPVTLRNLPAASQPNTGGGVEEQLSRLSGPAYEAAFAKLTPAQRARMLDED